MAALMSIRKGFLVISRPQISVRGIQTSSILHKKRIRAGCYKISKKQNIPLTYEEAKPPYMIGVEKSWSSLNTTNLKDEGRRGETVIEDSFIRDFMQGTWHRILASDVIIKRRHNTIYLAMYVENRQYKSFLSKIYFLVGYTEELLSCLLKCPVKLELQTVESVQDMTFKYI